MPGVSVGVNVNRTLVPAATGPARQHDRHDRA
jgi:hypothetical protein